MGLLDQLSQRSQRLSDDFSAYSDGDINGAQEIPQFIFTGLADLTRGAVRTPAAKSALVWTKNNPEEARAAMGALVAPSLLSGKPTVSAGNTRGGLLGASEN